MSLETSIVGRLGGESSVEQQGALDCGMPQEAPMAKNHEEEEERNNELVWTCTQVNIVLHKWRLAALCDQVGTYLYKNGDMQNALRDCRRALQHWYELLPKYMNLQASYLTNVSIYTRENDKRSAQIEERKVEAVRRDVLTCLQRVAYSHTRIGSILYKQNDLHGSLAEYQTALAMRQQMEPNSLVVSYIKNAIRLLLIKISAGQEQESVNHDSPEQLVEKYQDVLRVPEWDNDHPEQAEYQLHDTESPEELMEKYHTVLRVADWSAQSEEQVMNSLYEAALRVPDWSKDPSTLNEMERESFQEWREPNNESIVDSTGSSQEQNCHSPALKVPDSSQEPEEPQSIDTLSREDVELNSAPLALESNYLEARDSF